MNFKYYKTSEEHESNIQSARKTKTDMKKISVQNLAETLDLSRVTIWKVINNKPGVAPGTIQRVNDALRDFHEKNAGTHRTDPESKTVTLLASRAETSSFWMEMINQIAFDVHAQNGVLNYIPLDRKNMSLEDLQSSLHPEKTNGLLALNIYDEELINLLSQINLPKVFYDTIPELSVDHLKGDLILLDGKQTIAKIVSQICEEGHTKIGFIGDTHYALTNRLRWEGFIRALQEQELSLNKSLCFTKQIKKDRYQEDISSFLKSLKIMPTAIVCVSDYVAFIVIQNLLDMGFRVPKDIKVTGYDDVKGFLLDQYHVSTIRVQTDLLGKRMLNQLLYRINNPDADFEEIKIFPKEMIIL